MKAFLILAKPNHGGYDTYSGHVVVAESEDEARKLCPHADEGDIWNLYRGESTCEIIGNTKMPKGVILSSFHAG